MKTGFKILLGIAAVFGVRSLVTNSKKEKPSPTKISDDKKQGLGSILFVGDSNTFYPWTYGHQFIQKYPKTRSKLIAKIGAKTSWMLPELKKELLKNKYDAICILGGSNDIYAENKITNSKLNLDKLYIEAKKSGAIVIAISPPNHNFFTRRTKQKLDLQDELMSWIVKNPNKDYYLDFKKITNNKKYFSSKDGYLHAQKEAHTILLNELIGILKMSFK